jgi:uncharacterized protein YggU (UPF0235/DUF167 family)
MRYTVRVKTNTKHASGVIELADGSIVVATSVKPINGEANAAVISLLAKYFKTAKSNIKIIRGSKSKIKIVEII